MNSFQTNSPTPEVSPYYMNKYLHTEQPFPDNYIEDWFLGGMRVNYHLDVLPLKDIVRESLALSQQISTVIMYICIFLLTAHEMLPVRGVYVADIILLSMCFLSCIPLKISPTVFCGWRSIIIFGTVWGLVPVISTITTGYYPDSIYILSTVLFIIHICFFDYGYINNYVDEINGVLSYNAVLLASIVLASILPKNAMVFPLISLSIILFEFNPLFRHYLLKKSKNMYFLYSILLFIATFCFCFMLSVWVSIVYLFCVSLGTYVGPKFWLKIQSLKTEVSGAWDEAVPSTQ
ncbi:phosphatidylinositol N-acetylglucosaminyltransferase subunit C, putative [Entamoeba nuttalli P19]|uniref:Phosphatidylinositol N-acetylglucosaminyltransferase subunit C, putative n=2 Tax=Entamoeba nuttalli TaxID=412467 RepID=K2HAQ5_ENTNP|nr:phosphatidylinositol N-acetylglucosaminyltransferase subunit C, putative [Entamoeba nuttalli P19]EKE39699.1 phosphatidylinositol N-acetylglucosaminyltransferase subunit C, putative [Entamoeba nuttalli P19]|eukprot:XP_008857967.1 phosphatidylinositol N-acetylglucosaminyltransferase subunit C, putative [Entamoeba nuttalli P19]